MSAGREIGRIGGMGRATHVLAIVGVVLAQGCDDPPPAHGARTEEEARRADPEDPARAPAATGSHGPDDACAAALTGETPERVRATLHAIGYDDVFHDTCLAERAEQEHDASLCEQLVLPSLTRRCVLRVAVIAGTPLACPHGADDARDPLCVALAARDRRLCAAAGLAERAVCEEALGREHRCNHLPDEVRGDCDARAVSLGALVTGEVTTSPALATALSVRIGGEETPMSASAIERGATIDWSGCSPLVRLGDAEALTLPFGGGALAITARVDAPTPATVAIGAIVAGDVGATLELTPPRGRRTRASGGTIRVRTLELALGGRIEGTFEASLSGSDAPVEGTFETFVRDLAPRPASCDLVVPASPSEGEEQP